LGTIVSRDTTAQEILSRLGDTENYPDEHLAPYQEFRIGANTYYFTPGGFLYRKDPGSEEVGASFVATSPTKSGTTGPERVAELEKNRDALLASLMSMVPEALDTLTSEERRQVYKILKLRVSAYPDGSLEVSGAFGEDLGVREKETAQVRCSG
jgi:hypothetical protein